MQDSWSYNKGSSDFLTKIENISGIPVGAFLVTKDVAGLYPSIPHGAGLEALQVRLNEGVCLRYRLPIQYRWQICSEKLIFLNWIGRSNNKN